MVNLKTTLFRAFLLLSLVVLLGLTGCTPSGVVGTVTDASSGAPLSGVTVASGDVQAQSDTKGSFQLSLPTGSHHVTVSLAGYHTYETDVTLDSKNRRVTLNTALEVRVLTGTIVDAQTKGALSGVTCQLLDAQATTNTQGQFTLPAQTSDQVTISKHGYYDVTLEPEKIASLFDQDGHLVSELAISLEPRTVQGKLTEEGTGAPIAEATVQIGDQVTTTDASGVFTLSVIDPGEKITVTSAKYRVPSDLTYDGEATLAISLKPYQAILTIQDADSGEPLPEATIQVTKGQVSLQDDGSYLARIVPGTVISASLVGYKNASATYNGEEALTLKLAPAQLVGQLTAADNGQPISNAVILAYTQQPDPVVLRSDKDGRFYYPEDNPVSKILIKAPGYERISMPITRTGMIRLSLAPFEVNALYIPFGLLYDRAAFEAVLDLAKDTAVNGLVVDLKDDWAKTAWDSQVPLAKEIGAYNPDVMDAKDVIALAHERGLYVVGRMVVFKDNLLAQAHPEYAVQRYSGGYYVDLEGLMWVDPFRPEVRQYNIDLALELAAMGIDEVQYDYIRFPSDGSVEGLVYSQEANYDSRTTLLAQFVGDTHAALMKTPAFFSVDVFGLVPLVEPGNDMGIGQTMEAIAPNVDYLCPMLYPTTFGPGELGYATPGIYPYEVVYRSIMAAHERSDTKIRPWLQSYSIYGIEYGVIEHLLQRKAADDANSTGWTFWNAAGWYDRPSLENNVYDQYPAVINSTPETMR